MMALVFDAHEWDKSGDVGDNSKFWKPAKIITNVLQSPVLRRATSGRTVRGWASLTRTLRKRGS